MNKAALRKYEAFIGILNAVAIVGYLYALIYISKIRNEICVCAAGWKQDTLYYSSMWLALMSFVTVIACITGAYSKFIQKHKIIDIIVLIISLAYVVLSYYYLEDLQKKNCNCSDGLQIMLISILKFLIGVIATYSMIFFLLIIFAAFSFAITKFLK